MILVVVTPYDYMTTEAVSLLQIPTLLSKLRSFHTTRFPSFIKPIVYFKVYNLLCTELDLGLGLDWLGRMLGKAYTDITRQAHLLVCSKGVYHMEI
jgi:hypothetical protein